MGKFLSKQSLIRTKYQVIHMTEKSEQEMFEEEMLNESEKLYKLLKQKDELENKIDTARADMLTIFGIYNRDEYNEPESPLIVSHKMVSTGERMKRGGKDTLRSMLTSEQWEIVYNKPGEKAQMRVKRRDRITER